MKLGVIGCGRMGTALVAGAVRAGAIDPALTRGFDPFPAAAQAFAEKTGATIASDPGELADCDAFLLATKPQTAADALEALHASGAGNALLVSIAAGLTIDWIQQKTPESFRIVRCMPNTPALIGSGASGYARGTTATDADGDFTARMLGAVGIAVEVPEPMLDAVTGLSGSGPAYIYTAIDALSQAGVGQGLPADTALQLATQTVLGAARMVEETGLSPADLTAQVTSPGGTTLAGLAALEETGFRQSLEAAVTAATRRAIELGQS